MKVSSMNKLITPAIFGLMIAVTVSSCDSDKDSRVGKRSGTANESSGDATVDTKAVDGPGVIVAPEQIIVVESTSPTPTPPPVVVDLMLADVGMKSFNQINATMAVVTGVAKSTPAIVTEFEKVKAQLPTTNTAASFAAANQGSITKLAITYCDVAIANATIRAALIPTFNFAPASLAVGFTAPMKDLVIQNLTEKFWGAELALNPDLASAKLVLNPLIDKMVTNGLSVNNVNQSVTVRTQNIVKAVCAAVLASSPVTML